MHINLIFPYCILCSLKQKWYSIMFCWFLLLIWFPENHCKSGYVVSASKQDILTCEEWVYYMHCVSTWNMFSKISTVMHVYRQCMKSWGSAGSSTWRNVPLSRCSMRCWRSFKATKLVLVYYVCIILFVTIDYHSECFGYGLHACLTGKPRQY